MAFAAEEETEFALSDVEADDEPSPVNFATHVSVERLRELLDREKQARLAAENSNNELQVSFNRLKVLAHEAIKKRDDSNRLHEEASRTVERLRNELAEANRSREEISKHRDEIVVHFDEAVKAKDSLRSEVESVEQLLVSGIEKISGKVNRITNFSGGALPRSQTYTGLPAIAYGVIVKSDEIVEELLKQIDLIGMSRNEVAIEFSQMEATIEQLREEVAKRTGVIEHLERSVSSGIEDELSEKLRLTENEALGLKKIVEDYDDKLRRLESKMEYQRPLLLEQLNLISRVHDQLYSVIKLLDMTDSDQLEVSEALFFPQATEMEENIQASLAGLESMHELSMILVQKARDLVEDKDPVVKCLNETVAQLVRQKEHVEVLLRSAVSKRLKSDPSSKTNKMLQVAGVTEEDDIYALAGALENIVEESQVEISELQHFVDELRAESSEHEEQLEAQAKELSQKKLCLEELEQKERDANESVEGLMMDVAVAEEEITRWKAAAEQEAAAGRAIEQDYLTQISAHKQEIKEAKRFIIELEKKLKFKEETAAAAMAARNTAEKSLALVDMRASLMRERVEELTHQLEEVDAHRDRHRTISRPRYACWPWEWLGVDLVGLSQTEPLHQQRSNEMELSEPLI